MMEHLSWPFGGQSVVLAADMPMPLDSGLALGPFTLAFQTYGQLNPRRDNAILIFHALSGDQFVAEPNPMTRRAGWWDTLVGPGKTVDTGHWFVICANILGGCMGSSGPIEVNPATGRPWALDFPMVTLPDMVRSQRLLLDYLGIEKLFAVIGGSMGGMMALQFATDFPHSAHSCLAVATMAHQTVQNIAFNEVGRQAIMADPDWCEGQYLLRGKRPARGLAVARMGAHINYMSPAALTQKFGRALQDRARPSYGFEADFQVESYLRHQGTSFVDRFDANSYLYITRAMDYFDLAATHGGVLAKAFMNSPVLFGVVSFSSDWRCPTSEARRMVHAMNAAGAEVSFVEIESDKGHDAFLLEEPEFFRVVGGFLDGVARRRG